MFVVQIQIQFLTADSILKIGFYIIILGHCFTAYTGLLLFATTRSVVKSVQVLVVEVAKRANRSHRNPP